MKRTFTKHPVSANTSIASEARKYIKEWAYDSFNYGHVMDVNDYDEFARICEGDGVTPSKELFALYYDYVDEARETYYSDGEVMGSKVTDSQERGTVQTYRNRRNPNKYIEVKKGNDGHSYARQYMEWDRPDGKVKNYTGAKDAKRGRYSRARRDTINQMLEDYDSIESSSAVTSGFSFDFIWTGKTYDDKEIRDTIEDIFDRLCLSVLSVDFENVDYSMYPEYADKNVSQCHVDFEWSDNYADTEIAEMTEERLRRLGYDVIGTDFYTI